MYPPGQDIEETIEILIPGLGSGEVEVKYTGGVFFSVEGNIRGSLGIETNLCELGTTCILASAGATVTPELRVQFGAGTCLTFDPVWGDAVKECAEAIAKAGGNWTIFGGLDYDSCRAPALRGQITNKGATVFVTLKATVELVDGRKFENSVSFEAGPFWASP